MNLKKLNNPINRIVQINKHIHKNNLHKIPPFDPQLSIGYSSVKPLLEEFKADFGLTPPKFLESLFDSVFGNFPEEDKLFELKSFKHWGRRIQNYVWAAIYLKNDKKQPYSNSIQIYILVDHLGVKFGFGYGDKVKNSHKHVDIFRSNKELQNKMLAIINDSEFKLNVIKQEAGSPIVKLNVDKKLNFIKTIDDFDNWNEKIHITRSRGISGDGNNEPNRQIHYETQRLFARFRDLIISEPDFLEEKNTNEHDLFHDSQTNVSNNFSQNLDMNDIFINQDEIENIIRLLDNKKNIILQGPPGTGKTFIAKKLCHKIQNSSNPENISTIQFHQSYSYEDFIQGYRPTDNGFELRNGIFMNLCEKAKDNPEEKFFIIIDEINRGNLSKIFGELMMLIEHDKRGKENSISLTYSKSSNLFYVPENLFIIGTMNTADRSLSIVDYALRRRFAFIDMMPKFNRKFEDFLKKLNLSSNIINKIKTNILDLNEMIKQDESLGEGFCIGHSYFCSYNGDNEKIWLNNIFEYEIKPLLKEYWFDDEDSLRNATNTLIES